MPSTVHTTDTITAPATPPGCGGVGIVRVSGPLVLKIAAAILNKSLRPRYATFVNFLAADQTIIDQGVALYFPAPNSFTGEDVLELQCHGGPIIIDNLLRRVLELGARMAKPGEFSERAFLNNKIDLTQAEAIADLINATTKQAAQNALNSLQGKFAARIHELVEKLINLRAYIEAAIDFAEEDIDFLDSGVISNKLACILWELQFIQKTAEQGVILREGLRAVITGKPNAGKSSLLNCLSGQETAIVTEIPGTTRDVLHAFIQLDGLAINLIDTAGLRDNPDIIESEGIRRAREEIKKANHVLIIVDAAAEKSRDAKAIVAAFAQPFPEKAPTTVIFNKIDLTGEPAKTVEANGITSIYVSVANNLGLDLLKQHLKTSVGLQTTENGFSARRRHLEALNQAEKYILAAQYAIDQHAFELIADDLNFAQRALGEITGEFTSEDLLTRIFSEFCIGK